MGIGSTFNIINGQHCPGAICNSWLAHKRASAEVKDKIILITKYESKGDGIMSIKLEETKELNTKKGKRLTDKDIEQFCKGVEELLEDIHERCNN